MDIYMSERRSEHRLLCAELLRLEWAEVSGWQKTTTVLLEDISSQGACVQMEVPVSLGAQVELFYGSTMIPATVSYCEYREIGYYTGLAFEEGFRWSEQNFQPQHLLDTRGLLAHTNRTTYLN